MKNLYHYIFLLAIVLMASGSIKGQRDVINVNGKNIGDKIPASLYGVFFEEISHAGDGGLYAEMVQNRGFEDGTLPSGTTLINGFACAPAFPCYSNDSINRFKIRWDDKLSMNAWTVVNHNGKSSYKITSENPLDRATPHALRLDLNENGSVVSVINNGYWGMALNKGGSYHLTFWMKTSQNYQGELSVYLKNTKGEIVDVKQLYLGNNTKWAKYEVSFTSSNSGNDYRLYLDFKGKGSIYLDYVSLFPVKTYKGRINGLRNDIAEFLGNLKPAFIRWPGGCIAEGLTLENRVKWKETIGDPMKRPGEYNLWGYRSTYGFGYHEFLQYCEDIQSDAMFVCNAGMACLFRNGDYVEEGQLTDLIQEALDAIEYAIGDTNTIWGKQRAINGHPEPFPLKYVEIGNENVGKRYAAHYKQFYKAIKKRYPALNIICALMFHPEVEEAGNPEFIDPHYYETADWFYRNDRLYDHIPAIYGNSKIYIGEYAATGNPSLYSSLGEAAFLTGVERNSSRIQLVSYAPLFQNANHGNAHMIVYDNNSVYGRTNYHIMKMFALNRPDFNLETTISPVNNPKPLQFTGKIGLGSCGTSVQYKDFIVEKNGQAIYTSDFSDLNTNWRIHQGNWNVSGNILTQTDTNTDGYIFLETNQREDCTIRLKARKIKGREGFRIFFGAKDIQNYYMADLGSHQNESVIFGERKNGVITSLFDYRNTQSIRAGEWYDVRIEIKGNHWKCYLNNKLSYEYTCQPLVRHYAVSGYDQDKKELILKLVNGENKPWKGIIRLTNITGIKNPVRQIQIHSPSANSENSLTSPQAVIPQTKYLQGVKDKYHIDCPPNSFTILRIPCSLSF